MLLVKIKGVDVTMEIKKTEEEINKCLEYVEDKEKFKTMSKEIKIFLSKPKLKKYFDEDKQERNVYRVTITRNKDKTSFMYGDSINNTEEGKQPDIYTILCCCGSDYHTEENFKDFCSEFGYNEDSIKALKLHKKCLKQSEKIKKIFTEEEARNLPT